MTDLERLPILTFVGLSCKVIEIDYLSQEEISKMPKPNVGVV